MAPFPHWRIFHETKLCTASHPLNIPAQHKHHQLLCCFDNGPPSAFSSCNSSSFLYLTLSACALLAFTACHLAACVTYRKANEPWLYVALAGGATSRMYKGTAAL
ncbi:hypothetical protein GE21DRAFT_1102058 [Neurospora crassa]|nr:hypothetical protein GE21DRAFT_1102058 [Neurospora crassa]